MNRSLLDLARLAHARVAALRSEDAGHPVGISIAPCMWADGEPLLLEQLLEVLLGNAWKYARHSDQPSIEVGTELDEKIGIWYFVRDNGPGLGLPATRTVGSSLLRVGAQQLAGLGRSLASVRRIIDMHGGALHATWRPGVGTTFYFSLPPAEDDTSS